MLKTTRGGGKKSLQFGTRRNCLAGRGGGRIRGEDDVGHGIRAEGEKRKKGPLKGENG